MSDLMGQSIGPFVINLKLGSGGMADVYRAYDRNLDREVAIKILPLQQSEISEFVARFKAEARAIGKLKHPNIVQVFTADVYKTHCYIVMELVADGQTLRSRINQGLSIWQSLELIQQIGDALQYVHSQGIVHRDIKPNNVLMNGDWPLLSDFGLAKMAGSTKLTHSRQLQGTAKFMAPEQFKGAEVDNRADIYALALILYEMLTGNVPHQANNFIAIGIKRNQEKPVNPRTFNPNIPLHIEQALLKALALRPEERFSSVAYFLQALEPFPNSETNFTTAISTLPVSQVNNTSTPTIKQPKKWTTWLWYIAGIAVIVLIATLSFMIQTQFVNNAAVITTPDQSKITIASETPMVEATPVGSTISISTPDNTILVTSTSTESFEPPPIFFDVTPNEIVLGEEARLQWDVGDNAKTVQIDVIVNHTRQAEGTYLYKPNRTGNITVTLSGNYVQTGLPFTETVTILVKTPTPMPTDTIFPTSTPTSIPTNTPTALPISIPFPTEPAIATMSEVSEMQGRSIEVVSPIGVEETYSSDVTFVWRWDEILMDNFGFEIRLWQEGNAQLGVHSAVLDNKNGVIQQLGNNEYSLTIGDLSSTAPVQKSGSGIYNWTVLLIQLEPYDSTLGIEAAPGQLRVGTPKTGNSNGQSEKEPTTILN